MAEKRRRKKKKEEDNMAVVGVKGRGEKIEKERGVNVAN